LNDRSLFVIPAGFGYKKQGQQVQARLLLNHTQIIGIEVMALNISELKRLKAGWHISRL
jgi:hypothetical protein